MIFNNILPSLHPTLVIILASIRKANLFNFGSSFNSLSDLLVAKHLS